MRRGTGRLLLSFAACLMSAAVTQPARAGWFGLRNDTRAVLVVQRATVVKGVALPSRPLVLYPGETAWDSVVRPCVKAVTVYDPQQLRRPLLEQKLACGGNEFYSVQVAGPGQLRLAPSSPL